MRITVANQLASGKGECPGLSRWPGLATGVLKTWNREAREVRVMPGETPVVAFEGEGGDPKSRGLVHRDPFQISDLQNYEPIRFYW